MSGVSPAWIADVAIVVASCYRRSYRPARTGVLVVLARGWADKVREREHRATLRVLIANLPAGACIVARDGTGHEYVIGPSHVISSVRAWEALR